MKRQRTYTERYFGLSHITERTDPLDDFWTLPEPLRPNPSPISLHLIAASLGVLIIVGIALSIVIAIASLIGVPDFFAGDPSPIKNIDPTPP